jgi:kinesin family protein 1
MNDSFTGFNTSLFAYGQTGAGKGSGRYTAVLIHSCRKVLLDDRLWCRYANAFQSLRTNHYLDKGIIPLACAEMFNRINSQKDPNVSYKVEVSYMEIYNEKVNDLLNPKNNKPGGLKVRNHPTTGPYVSCIPSLLKLF